MDKTTISTVAKLARLAFSKKEVPIGAVILDAQGNIIGRGYNRMHGRKDATEHAEIMAIKQAAKRVGDWRLDGCHLVVNLEPCLMCLGAIANSRIKRVTYFLADSAFGSAESKLTPAQLKKLFPKLIIKKVADTGETKALLQQFFKQLRKQ
ncbi:nucleoside deaminase [Patescibacteria group bacterium]|nr:nucleoside deaminase [Patescibacteria group bacterium]